jgi:branched-chain amino acid transport system ATP-binding protein
MTWRLPVFELSGLRAGYGDTTVLRGVDLAVPPGSVVALIGSNGAGKTTLLRSASGLLRPSAGTIRFGDADLTGRPPHVFANAGICHVPEGRGIFKALSVRENILLQAGKESASAALERATSVFPILGDRLSQQAGTMSGGEQQMLALARAYVSRPQVVLLDEVSMGLAPRIVDEIFEFLRLLADEGTALLIVEQYVVRALELADYLFILNRGEITFAGQPSEIDVADILADYLGGHAVAG